MTPSLGLDGEVKMKTLRALTLLALPPLALLSAPFPLVAQQSVGHARVGTLTRIATVDLLHESAPLSVGLAAPTVPRQRGARLLHPTEYMPPPARQTVDGLRNWGTRVLEVSTRDE